MIKHLQISVPEYVQNRKEELKKRIKDEEVILAVIQVGDDPASNSYIKGKKKDCEEVGIHLDHYHYPADFDEVMLMQTIDILNLDDSCHGIIVQLPLPPHIDVKKVQMRIDPKKDVDGFHPMSEFKPCTPMGVINYLKANDYRFEGKNALVIGRSDIVGKPLAELLTDLDCTVTLAHSKTYGIYGNMLGKHLVFTATNKIEYYTEFYSQVLRDAEVVIDIGLGRSPLDNKLHGNMSRNLVEIMKYTNKDIVSGIGGVGLLTRLQLVENTIIASGL